MGEELKKGWIFIIEVENPVRFLLDDWVGIGPLVSLFQRLFRVVSNKQTSI